MTNEPRLASTRPYLIRALHEWCTDNGFTPYVAVRVDDSVQVPREYVKNGEIVLNVSVDATSALRLGNELIEFKARFSGVARDIMVPVGRVMAIYARENGQGMAFPLEEAEAHTPEDTALPEVARSEPESETRNLHLAHSDGARREAVPEDGEPEPPRPGGGRPALKRVK